MATLALSRDMLAEYSKLEKRAQNKVSELAERFRQMTAQELRVSKSPHLERYAQSLDDRARTIRIDSNHRGVVLDAGDDELFILTKIDTHDKVDHWMLNNEFRVNEATGALEIHNPEAVRVAVQESVAAAPPAAAAKLFGHRKDKDFTQLGVDDDLIPALRAFTSEEQLLAILGVLPQGQADALILLTGEESVESIYSQIAGSIMPEEIDTGNVAAAISAPASMAQFHVVADDDELQEMLAQPLAAWRTYLHPSQREAAYKPVYNGPARVTGGAGTGKTVVAIHRAAHLASTIKWEGAGKPILFTTFTRNLAEAIERDLRALGGTEVTDLVEVVNIDSLARRVVLGSEEGNVRPASSDDTRALWQEAADEIGSAMTPEFLDAEFEQVILANRCGSRSDYFNVSRAGRGVRLDRRGRAQVWKAVEYVLAELSSQGKRTYLQLADDAAGYLRGRSVKPFAHVLVDEAQDLHEAQWRLIRAAVEEGPNDLFIVGDSHQRIYDRRTSLSKVGINIIGRSRRLKINYRTTHEILRWALALLGEGTYDDLDDGTEMQTLAEYHSFLHGTAPTMVAANAKRDQLLALVEQIRSWRDAGVETYEIAVAARTAGLLDAVEVALNREGILTTRLQRDAPESDGVRLATMHRLKGVEFRCVAIVDVDDDNVPSQWSLTPERVDPTQHETDLRRERCTVCVAATRARDHLWVGWSARPSRFLVPMLGGVDGEAG